MSRKKKKKKHKNNSAQKVAAPQSRSAKTEAHKAADRNTTYNQTAAKKAVVLGVRKKSRGPLIGVIACALLVVGLTYYFIPVSGKEPLTEYAQPVSSAPVSEITYPVSLFDDGNARHFRYRAGGITIKYFIIKSSDGVIRAAYDACDVCWPANKGYYQEGDDMVCRNCGRKFASVLVNEVQGGCNPAPLNRNVENGKVVIRVADILKGKQYFNFSGKV